MYASSCCSHPSLILKRVITSSWSSRVTTASLPAPLTFFLPLSSFAAHFWLRIFSFNSKPNVFQRASHWTTDNPEMSASANRRFLSRSQKSVCESATLELILIFEGGKLTLHFFLAFLVFLGLLSCFRKLFANLSRLPTGQLQRQAPASAMASCFFSLISRTFSSRGKTIDLSPVRGEKMAASRPMVWRKSWNWKPTIQNDRPVVFRDLCSVSAYFFNFCIRSALATAWQPRGLPPCEPRQ